MSVHLSAGDVPREGGCGEGAEAGPRAAHQRVPRHRVQVPRRGRAEGARRHSQQGKPTSDSELNNINSSK